VLAFRGDRFWLYRFVTVATNPPTHPPTTPCDHRPSWAQCRVPPLGSASASLGSASASWLCLCRLALLGSGADTPPSGRARFLLSRSKSSVCRASYDWLGVHASTTNTNNHASSIPQAPMRMAAGRGCCCQHRHPGRRSLCPSATADIVPASDPLSLPVPTPALVARGYSELVTPEIMAPLADVEAAGWERTSCPHLTGTFAQTWAQVAAGVAAGGNVELPADSRVVISACDLTALGGGAGGAEQPYGTITVPAGSELVFDDFDIELHAKEIRVEGALRIGSDTCRLCVGLASCPIAGRCAVSAAALACVRCGRVSCRSSDVADSHAVAPLTSRRCACAVNRPCCMVCAIQ
jgi:hypothetical protein